MRNLKRALSLALASVMLLGMMVVGSSAASFPDVDDNDNIEAIEVLKAVDVMIGNENGDFEPDKPVTRAEMAVIMTNLLGLNAKDFASYRPFTDVPDWAANYVAACQANGIIAGRGDGIYDPNSTVTATEAAAMMLRALGYFQHAQDYGEDWARATVQQAAKIRLFDSISTAKDAAMDRNSVAQLALNTLESDMVDFTGEMGMEVEMGDGKKVTVGYKSEYSPKVDGYGTSGYNYANDPTSGGSVKTHQQEYLQLCEELYDGKLRQANTGSAGTDGMQRPGYTWTFKGKEIIFAAEEADHTYVIDKTGKTVATYVTDVLKENWTYAATPVYVNGGTGAGGGTGVANTYNLKVGSTVEFYMDGTAASKVNKVIVTEPTVYTLTADADSKVDGKDTQVKVPGVSGLGGFVSTKTTENVVGWEGLKKDDVVLVYVDKNGSGTTHISLADTVTGVVTGKKDGTKLVVDGKDYAASGLANASNAWEGTNNYTDEYTFYLDASGAIIKAVKNTDNAKDEFAFILETKWVTGGKLGEDNYGQARLLYPDGTNEVVTVSKVNDTDAAAGTGGITDKIGTPGNTTTDIKDNFATYKKNSDGKYELTLKDTSNMDLTFSSGADLEGNKANFTGSFVGNTDTIFLVNTKAANDPDVTAYTGIANMTTIEKHNSNEGKVYVDDGMAKYVYVKTTDNQIKGSDGEYIYIPGTGDNYDTKSYTYVPESSRGKGDDYYLFDAIVNGKPEQVKLEEATANIVDTDNNGAADAAVAVNTLYKVKSTNSEGVIKLLSNYSSDVQAGTGVEVTGSTLKTSGLSPASYIVNDSTEIYRIEKSGAVAELTADGVKKDSTDLVYVVKTSNSDKVADRVIIVEGVSNVTKITKITYVVNGVEHEKTFTTELQADSASVTVSEFGTAGQTVSITKITCANEGIGVANSTSTVGGAAISVTVTAEDGTTAATMSISFAEPCAHAAGTATPAGAATCTADGTAGYWTCDNCGTVFTDSTHTTPTTVEDQKIDATGHQNRTSVPAVKGADCQTNGVKAYWTCDDCGAELQTDAADAAEATDDWKVDPNNKGDHSWGSWSGGTTIGDTHTRTCTTVGCSETQTHAAAGSSGTCTGASAGQDACTVTMP